MTIGEHLRKYRCEHQMTQEELAKILNCHPSHISYIENGWTDRCTFHRLAQIVFFLNLSAEETYDIIKTYYEQHICKEETNA